MEHDAQRGGYVAARASRPPSTRCCWTSICQVSSGIEACKTMRSLFPRIPILMPTVRDSEDDKVEALDAGAEQLHHEALPVARADSQNCGRNAVVQNDGHAGGGSIAHQRD